MLSLHTNLTLETIKKNKKLQKIEVMNYWVEEDINIYTAFKKGNKLYWGEPDGFIIPFDKNKYLPAPTIADIIDNAESLFGYKNKIDTYDTVLGIILGCFWDKPLKEIEKYILDNIK